jgi:hypothetical protein
MGATPLKNGYVHVRQSEHRVVGRFIVVWCPAVQRRFLMFGSGMSSELKSEFITGRRFVALSKLGGVEVIDENGAVPGVRLRKRQQKKELGGKDRGLSRCWGS